MQCSSGAPVAGEKGNGSNNDGRAGDQQHLDRLRALERKVLWLSTWMIHHANHVRPKRDGLKVGGHQASCASLVTLMTGLFFDILRPQDRVAVKPHASPVFHAIQYLLGRQSREMLERFRGYGGAQSYPSRTKDADGVDFSTGSVGLGVAMTLFASLVQDYLKLKGWISAERGSARMIALAGDAELDEGNIFEALLEGWKHQVRNVWWVVDYNRQSLDSVVEDRLSLQIDTFFRSLGWEVVTLKYGKRLEEVFQRQGGDALRNWIDSCPNSLYSALVYRGGSAWREHLKRDLAGVRGITELLEEHDDAGLQSLMTNLGGHDMETILEAFHGVDTDAPMCFLAYTIKGYGLPLAGHKDNHSGLMSPEQMQAYQQSEGIAPGQEWERFAGLEAQQKELEQFLERVPYAARGSECKIVNQIAIPESLPIPSGRKMSTQEGFGRLLHELARDGGACADRVVTCSPDVTVSTNLGAWVNRRGIFHRNARPDSFRQEQILSAQLWEMSPQGQHIELGIAENNLFLLLAALGLAGPIFGERLIPIGTLYDPFINRGLDALNYACYQDARFILVATPSGITLAPEGGAHQSIVTPLIGIGQPGLTAFEPSYVDELASILHWSLSHLQAEDGGSVYLRLSTRTMDQPARILSAEQRAAVVEGGYWLIEPEAGAKLAIVCAGVTAAEALAAHAQVVEDLPGAGVLAVTSADRLHGGWLEATRARMRGAGSSRAHVEELLSQLAPDASLVTVLDGHPATLSWLGSVRGHRVVPLGVDRFGQSGDLADLYRAYRIDADAIVKAIARACLDQVSSCSPLS